MKNEFLFLTGFVAAFTLTNAQDKVERVGGSIDGDVSLRLEIERSIEKGVKWLEAKQDAETGAWSEKTLPAFSALAISAIVGDPTLKNANELPESAKKGFEFLVSNQKSDGGIYGKGLATYNTALSVTALSQSGNPDHLPVINKARRLLINQQQDFDKRGVVDNDFDGGIGYGGSYAHSDLSNTHLALEALYYSKKALADTEHDETSEFDLDWGAAIEFVSLCQNSEDTSKKLGDTVTVREEDRGGFIYFPGSTKSDVIKVAGDDGKERTALRSYGSMGYAGMLAFIYADMDMEDPRMQSVLSWLKANYTLEENPGMDAQGLFYYYHTMSKALSTAGIQTIKTPEGKEINWRKELALRVMSHQAQDGSWINEQSNRWLEDNEVLVTAYSLLTLQHVYRSL